LALFVFDFDGTLVDSNALKRAAFGRAAADLPGADAALARILAGPPRGDRAATLGALAEAMGRPDALPGLLDRYETIVRAAILARLANGWAADFLGAVRAAGHRAYVNSATPQAPLDAILAAAGLDRLIAGAFGGFGRKTENLRAILDGEGAATATVVGDGADDADSARACGCAFLRVDDGANALFRMPVASALARVEAAA
jgi:phosphoglycolate phosphatase-like HAD superfamily hydrolase